MQNNKYIVYCHITPSGKRYVGITSIGTRQRFANGKGYRTQTVFYRAIQKYGWNNIQHIVLLENLDYEHAKRYEQYFIALFKTNCHRYNNPSYGYNMDDGGGARQVGIYKLSEETKEKLSNTPYNDSRKTKINYFDLNGNYIGTANTFNEAQKITGVRKENILKAVKKRIKSCGGYQFRYFNEEDIQKGIGERKVDRNDFTKYDEPIYQYSLEGKFIREFCNPRTAEKITGYSSTHIIECAKGISQVSYGYIWQFEKHDRIKKRDNSPTYPRKINQFDLCGNYINTFDSIAEACRSIGKKYGQNIIAVCRGRRENAFGYKWEYAC